MNVSDSGHPEIIGQQALSGALGVAVQRNLALVAAYSSGLQLVNISDPRNPVIIGHQALPGLAWSVAVQSNLALVAAYNSGLQLVNISDPRHPVLIGGQIFLLGVATGVAAKGDLAAVAVSTSGLQLVNISDPRHPTIIGYQALLGSAYNVAIQGEFAFVVITDSSSLYIVNISNPRHPAIIGHQDLPGSAVGVAVQGDLVFVAAFNAGLQLVNVTYPTEPHIMGQVQTNCDSFSVAVQKNLAIVGCRSDIKIVDLKNTAWTLIVKAPVQEHGSSQNILLQSISLPKVVYQKYMNLYSSSRPYLHGSIPGLTVRPGTIVSHRFETDFWDVGGTILPFQSLRFSLVPGHPLPPWLILDYFSMIGNADLSGSAAGVAVEGELVVVAVHNLGIELVNISNPRHPVVIGKQALPGTQEVVVRKDLALVAADTFGLWLINISDPMHPSIISCQTLPSSAWDVAVQGDLALVAADSSGLQLVNISDPRHPVVIGSQALPGSATGVAVQGDLVLVAAAISGVQLVNISNPRFPVLIGRQTLPGLSWSITVQRNLAFVAAYNSGLHLVNISNPINPVVIGHQALPGAQNVAVQGDFALVSADNIGIQLISIRNPQYPVLVDSIDILGGASQAATQDSLTFVATTFKLNIIRYGLSGAVLSVQPTAVHHDNYFINITATNSDGITGHTIFRLSVNNPPILKNPFASKIVNVDQVMSFQLPKDGFYDADGDTLRFSSTLVNGTELPNWITFFADGQIFTIIPKTINRGVYNLSVKVDDGYFGTAETCFSLLVPTRKPIKVSDIPSQNAFTWRPFELLVPSETFKDLDGDLLYYRAQLKGARSLPRWLCFDNTTCVTNCRFYGEPGVTDLSDLEVELLARSAGGEASAEFSIMIRTSTLFQDLATYYSVSGGGLVVLSLLARFWRWLKMRKLHTTLKEIKDNDEKESTVTRQSIEKQLKDLLNVVDDRQTQLLKQKVIEYSQQVLKYAKQNQCTILEVGYPWEVIKKICAEIAIRMMHRLDYKDIHRWAKGLHRLLQIIIESESEYGSVVLKTDKENLISILDKTEKYLDISKERGVQIKQQLQLCREALVSMDDTDSIKDNLCCRDTEMIVEIIKTMVVPPYGIMRLIYQMSNVPSGWYPVVIQLHRLAKQGVTTNEQLIELQRVLQSQEDWRIVYEGVGLLGKVVRETKDEKIQKQAIEGIQLQTRGLYSYQSYQRFWGRSPCCDKKSAWIRARAQAIVGKIYDNGQDVETGLSLPSLRQLLLQ